MITLINLQHNLNGPWWSVQVSSSADVKDDSVVGAIGAAGAAGSGSEAGDARDLRDMPDVPDMPDPRDAPHLPADDAQHLVKLSYHDSGIDIRDPLLHVTPANSKKVCHYLIHSLFLVVCKYLIRVTSSSEPNKHVEFRILLHIINTHEFLGFTHRLRWVLPWDRYDLRVDRAGDTQW